MRLLCLQVRLLSSELAEAHARVATLETERDELQDALHKVSCTEMGCGVAELRRWPWWRADGACRAAGESLQASWVLAGATAAAAAFRGAAAKLQR